MGEKVILITGGADGLGKAIAKELTEENKVVILAHNLDKIRKVACELSCDYELCDVSNYNDVQNAIDNIAKRYLRIDCLINNAGLLINGKIEDNEYEDIKKVVEVNTLGVMYMTKAVIPYMKKERDGIIININSQSGLIYKEERSIYYASKWAITGFTKCIQVEEAKHGIRVTGLYPGKMNTDLFKKIGIDKNMDDALNIEEVAKTVKFIISTDKSTLIPEIGMKNINE